MKDRKFYSGSSLDQALMKASRDLDIPKDELSYHQIEKKHGFLKMRRSIVIEVDPTVRATPTKEEAPAAADTPVIEEPRAVAEAPGALGATGAEEAPAAEESPAVEEASAEQPGSWAQPPAPETADHQDNAAGDEPEPVRAAPSADEAEAERAIRESLEILLDFAGVEMESSITRGPERFEIEIWGPDQDVMLRDNGRPLLSLQHLLVRLVRGMTGEAVYCRVDCDQFHEIREERLRDLAQRVASDVATEHRSRLLESMAPDERRIVHMTLANDPTVDTESQGNGYFKRVKVFPA